MKINLSSEEKFSVTAPSDEALLSFLTSPRASLIPHKVLTNEAFARKLLLGSMQRIGQDSSLRPDDQNDSLIISRKKSSDLETKFNIRIVDRVHGVSKEDLLEAIRVTPELGNFSSKTQYLHFTLCNSEQCTDYGQYQVYSEDNLK